MPPVPIAVQPNWPKLRLPAISVARLQRAFWTTAATAAGLFLILLVQLGVEDLAVWFSNHFA